MADWQTHVILAAKLLKSCGCEPGAAIYSVLPVADRIPANFHRVRLHIIANMPKLLDVAIEVFTEKNMNAETNSYEFRRISEDYEKEFKPLIKEAARVVGDNSVGIVSSDKVSAAVSLMSHLYFDTMNNPVQAFLPKSSVCSAQWDLWDSIDYLKFRNEFYNKENIEAFQKKIAALPVWETRTDPRSIIKAMIVRIGELSRPSIPYDVIDLTIAEFFRYLLGNDYVEHIKMSHELAFCRALEKEINDEIIREFGK